ncbi:MAG: response regulator [Candidatus Omnitrophica bacterium]|nr:response regulator [Candidatus Omnitrophota bacterium]
MPKRRILILEKKASRWPKFLEEFFEDTPSELKVTEDAALAGEILDRLHPDLVFFNHALVSPAFLQKVRVHRQTRSELRFTAIGAVKNANPSSLEADMAFEEPPAFLEFQKRMIRELPMPEKLYLLVVDDDPEIGAMIRDFLEGRTHPAFEIATAENGKKGLESILRRKPDVLVMDVKMPEMDGRELYRRIRGQQLMLPTIIFFDPISGAEMAEIRKYGRPAVVDKSSRHASLPDLTALILKMAYFG